MRGEGKGKGVNYTVKKTMGSQEKGITKYVLVATKLESAKFNNVKCD